ncbi:MAG TPA: hypothetical protein VJB37_00810 [Patescibacteria group bacterium]|nr:hypothetical protein [Patescibacteria group bacterium]
MYLTWDNQIITDFSDQNIEKLYNQGFLFTRQGKGQTYQTRSVRVRLADFSLTSENRRIQRKSPTLHLTPQPLPLKDYDWTIGKLAKDFYETKFGLKTFTANKIKQLLTGDDNFNQLLIFSQEGQTRGYCICRETKNLLHYSYPFYYYQQYKDLGMRMMLQAVLYAQDRNKKFIYLGSAQRPTDVYKLQFSGLEWFDGKKWQTDLDSLKEILQKST